MFGAFDVGWLCWILLRVCWLFECGEYCWVCLGGGFDCGIVGGMTNTGLVLVWFSVWCFVGLLDELVVCCNAFVCLALAWGLAFCLVLLIYG